jgi:hypothetical protein
MSRQYNYPIPNQGLNYVEPTRCDPTPNTPYPQRGGIDWTVISPKPKEKTFFEFAQTFWHNTINVRNRQFITDGKTGGYPTLQSIYWKYLESGQAINVPNDNFTYQTMIDYVNGLGTYWIKLIEQMIPATTIWNTGTKLENSIFHRQKFVWRRQMGCQLVLVPCKPCYAIGQLIPIDCPRQAIECPIYPWGSSPNVNSFGIVLGNVLTTYLNDNGYDLNNDCLVNSVTSEWYVDARLNGNQIVDYKFFDGNGYAVSGTSFPTQVNWLNALYDSLPQMIDEGLTYYIDETTNIVTIYNNTCNTCELFSNQSNFELNVGINFQIICNQ